MPMLHAYMVHVGSCCVGGPQTLQAAHNMMCNDAGMLDSHAQCILCMVERDERV